MELLSSARTKFRRLDRAVDKLAKYILMHGIPQCDFTINYAALKREREVARAKARTLKMQQSYKRTLMMTMAHGANINNVPLNAN